ncbi:hypothetical protein OAR11_00200 [Alphaproteobacteria bacterium]|nr:hypothetical protein [Alphaproteobacteria bacterium]
MFTTQHRLDNLNLVFYNNGISILGHAEEIVGNGDLSNSLSSFGWECWEVDVHDVNAVHAALFKSKLTRNERPKAIIAQTIKGHGVPDLENAALSHILNPKPKLIDGLLKELK